MFSEQNKKRFWSKVNIKGNDECWEWTAYCNKQGYGRFHVCRGYNAGAHHYSWMITRGMIPQEICVLHKCDNPKCVNPDHLFLGTQKDNMQDCIKKGRAHWQKKYKRLRLFNMTSIEGDANGS